MTENEKIQNETTYLINRLADVIRREERHQDYERVTELRNLYTKFITGIGMDTLLAQFTPREDTELFKQRLRITQHITKTVYQNIIAIYFKIPRSNSIQRNISYTNNDTKHLNDLLGKLKEFWGDNSLDDYMNIRWIELNFNDPNTFTVAEWGEFDNTQELATPYPFEVDSKMAIQFEFINNDLEYLVSEQKHTSLIFDKKQQKDVEVEKETYTIYGKNQTIKFVELEDEKAKEIYRGKMPELRNGVFIFGNYFIPSPSKDDVYEIIIKPPHKLGYVPAKRVGCIRDFATNGRTFVSPLDKATPILMKMVKANSEFDLTMALHAFPQKIQYASRCKDPECHNGTTIDGAICNACKGSGFEIIKTAQDIITLAMPKTKDEAFDLSNVIRYEYPPVELIQFQDAYIDKLTVFVKEAVFNTELFSKKEVSETATGKNISLQNIYDSLYPIASQYSKTWEFFVTTVADIIDRKKNLIAFYHFSKDFKLKSLSELYIDLKMVGDARASEFVKMSIESDIASIIYSEDERELKKYKVKQAFFPFSGKTPEQINAIIAGNQVTSFTKVFWANYGQIFDAVEMEQAENNIDFYSLAKSKQWEIIKAKVESMEAEIETENPEPVLPDLNETV
ncbi:MAG: hypothetical protein ACKOWO_01270 [Sediminibacterium sp.]